MAKTKVTFDFSQLANLDRALAVLTPEQIGEVNVKAVNQVVERSTTKARQKMIAGINLPDTYLRERMSVTLATNRTKPEAVIRAAYKHTLLSRYAARQLAAPGSRRSGGVTVEVTRGSPKTLLGGFMMPLKNGNGLGVFIRHHGAKKPTVLYGPSVYQLFRSQIDNLAPEILDDLQATTFKAITNLTRQAL